MARDTIPADATIVTIRTLLSNPEDYVRVVYERARAAMNDADVMDLSVRIGVTGNGHSPNFRLELRRDTGGQIGDPLTYRASGAELFKDNSDLEETRWSEQAMTFTEVRDLLGEIRGFAR